MEYNLSFYESKNRSKDDKWCVSIFAENDEEAIKKVEEKRKNGKYYYCKLYKIFYSEKIIKKWEK